MADAITILSDGELQTGIGMMNLAVAFKNIAKKNPGATLSTKQPMIHIEKGYGPAWVKTGPAKVDDQRRTSTTPADTYLLSPGSVLRLQHDNPSMSWTFQVTPSGRLRSEQSGDAPLITGPDIALPSAPACVQQALDWIYDGQAGVSAQALCDHLVFKHCGMMAKNFETNTPDDNSAFVRCADFLDRVPDAYNRLESMSEVSPAWAELVTPVNGVRPWDERVAQARAKNTAIPDTLTPTVQQAPRR